MQRNFLLLLYTLLKAYSEEQSVEMVVGNVTLGQGQDTVM